MISTPYRLMLNLKHFVTFLCVAVTVFLFLVIFSLSDEEVGRTQNVSNERGTVSSEQIRALQSQFSRTYKILCYVLLSQRKTEAAKRIKETWGSKCDKLVFFGRFRDSEIPVTYLDSPEGYKNLWGKTQKALMYLRDNYGDYDWFLKVDHDTFVVTENLRNFLRELDPDRAIWSGYKLKHKRLPTGYMSGGAGYVFTRSALENVTNLFEKIQNGHTAETFTCNAGLDHGLEDLELGLCFKDAGVDGVSSLDGAGKERFLPLPINSLWEGNVPRYHWLWRKAWNPLKLGPECCSPKIITAHEISPLEMKKMFNLLYKRQLMEEQETSNVDNIL